MRQFAVWMTAALVLSSASSLASAQRVLRLDEVAVGEIDPAKATDYADSMLVLNLYDTLVQPGGTKGVTPSLAKSWKVSPDGKTYTFTLRQGVKFHDGSTLTADDVVFSLQRMQALKQGFANLFEVVRSAKASSPTTVVFTLSKPYAAFLANLLRLQIVNKDLVLKNKQAGKFGANGDYGQAYLNTHDAGSGAYQVVSHDPQHLTVMKKFGGYFQSFAKNAPDTVRLSYSVDPTTVRTMMSRKEHDITSQWLPPETLQALNKAGSGLLQERGVSELFLTMNMQKAPTDDVHFRKAMALAFDYATLLKLLKITDQVSSGVPSNGPLPSTMLGHNKNVPFPKQNLEAARAELARSRYKAGDVPVEIGWVAEVPFEERIALLFQQNMAQLGIKVNVTKVPWALMTQKASKAASTPNVAVVYVSPSVPDPDAMLYPMYHSSSAGTWLSMSWLKNKSIDALLDQGRAQTNPAKRAALYQQLDKAIVDQQPAIFGYEQTAVFAKQPNVTVPTLENPAQTTAMTGGNFIFRLIDVK